MRGSAVFRTGVAPGGALAGPWVRNPLWTTARAVPSLDLRFADTKSLVDATTGSNLVTFTRASSGTFVGSDGLIQSASTDAPRFDHNPTTGESLGLLVEEARTNLLLQSNGFDTTWTNTNSSETAASGTAPDGTNTAWEFKDTSDGSATAHRLDQTVSFTSGVSYTLSIYAKVGSIEGIHFLFPSGPFGVDTRINFDLSLGTASVFAGTATASITNSGNGWYRCVATATASSTAPAAIQLRTMKVVSGTLSSFYQGDGTGTILVWGAQLEAGAFPTSYIPTTTATVTRSADVASISGSNFSAWYRQDEGTVFVEVPSANFSGGRILQIGDGTGANRQDLAFTSGGLLAFVNASNTAQVNAVTTNTTAGLAKASYGYKVDNFAWTLNAGPIRDDNSGSVPVVDRIGIGGRLDTAGYLNGTIRRLCFWPRRLGNEVLQGITQ